MPTRREYLSSLNPPLAKAKSRGRLSKAALAEVERARSSGITFSDEKEAGSLEGEPASPPVAPWPPRPVVRNIKNVSGYTKEGTLVRSDICFRCASHVSRCHCGIGIKASPILTRWDKDSLQYGAPIDAI